MTTKPEKKDGVQYGYTIPKRWGKIEIRKDVNGTPEVYLRRWYLFRCRWFSLRLHHIILPDQDPDPHDHPWWFFSIVLRGGYFEQWWRLPEDGRIIADRSDWLTGMRSISRFSFHRAKDAHRIMEFMRDAGAWTFFITGPERNSWGFVLADGTKVRWKDYDALGYGHTKGVGTIDGTEPD